MILNTTDTSLGQTVKATNLFDYLELAKGGYSRWVQKYIIENPYMEEGKEYLASRTSIDKPNSAWVKAKQ